MKKITLLSIILVGSIFSTSCGILKQDKDEELACGLANNLYTNGSEIGINDTDIGKDIAQSFTTGQSKMKIAYVDLILKSVGSPNVAQSINIRIQKDSAGVPDNVSIATAFIQVAQVDTSFKTHRFAFGEIELAANTKYWIRMSSDLASSNVNLVKWAGSAANPYASGEAKYFDGVSVWSNVAKASFTGTSHDLVFNLDCKK